MRQVLFPQRVVGVWNMLQWQVGGANTIVSFRKQMGRLMNKQGKVGYGLHRQMGLVTLASSLVYT